MSPTWNLRWLAVGVLLALAAPLHAQSFGFPWWKDAQFQRDLGLTADQTAKIDAIFQSTISLLRQKKAELDQQEDELSRMIAAGADESLVTRQVDKVEVDTRQHEQDAHADAPARAAGADAGPAGAVEQAPRTDVQGHATAASRRQRN